MCTYEGYGVLILDSDFDSRLKIQDSDYGPKIGLFESETYCVIRY